MYFRTFLSFSLSALLSLPVTAFSAPSQSSNRERKEEQVKRFKLAPDLEEILAQDDEEQRQALVSLTLAQRQCQFPEGVLHRDWALI